MCNIRRLIRIWWRRGSRCLDIAKSASARAGVTENHDSGGGGAGLAAGPALAEVGAARLLADGVQLQLPQLGLDGRVLGPAGDGLLHPLGLGQRLLTRPHLHRVREVPQGRPVSLQPPPHLSEPPHRGCGEGRRLRGRVEGLEKGRGGGDGAGGGLGEGSGQRGREMAAAVHDGGLEEPQRQAVGGA